jgi:signal transduction histidine kinase/DNA-binding response OmpR family regulator
MHKIIFSSQAKNLIKFHEEKCLKNIEKITREIRRNFIMVALFIVGVFVFSELLLDVFVTKRIPYILSTKTESEMLSYIRKVNLISCFTDLLLTLGAIYIFVKPLVSELKTKIIKDQNFLKESLISRTKIARFNQKLKINNHLLKEQKRKLKHKNVEVERSMHIAQKASKAKSEFLANVSHEIRTPMSAIIGYTKLLSLEEVPKDDKLKFAEIIERNGVHLLTLINDILDISKIEAGKFESEQVIFSPAAILADVVSLLGKRADEKGLHFKVEYLGELPKTIVGNHTRLRQILFNLVGNAIKFTDSGTIVIETNYSRTTNRSEQSSEKTPEQGFITFKVIDTGIGMSQEQLNVLFEPFCRLGNSESSKYFGSGLGLSISKRLATAMGGEIGVESTKHKGTTFRVTLPVQVYDGEDNNHYPTEGFLYGTQKNTKVQKNTIHLSNTVLLVEDSPDISNLVSFYLKRAGAKVYTASNGKEGIEKALEHKTTLDVILMDIQMPELNGLDAVKKLRDIGCTIPIIALTAYAMKEDRERCIEAGFTDYITKPVDIYDLLMKVKTISNLSALDNRSNELTNSHNSWRTTSNLQKHSSLSLEKTFYALPYDNESNAASVSFDEEKEIENLKKEFRSELKKKLKNILKSVKLHELNSLIVMTHQIAGSAASYGFPEISSRAKRAEQKLLTTNSVSLCRAEISDLIEAMKKSKNEESSLTELENSSQFLDEFSIEQLNR